MSQLEGALAWHEAGCSVIRARADGTKAPLGDWKDYQRSSPTRTTLESWFSGGYPGVGVVCGTVSGNLELLEFEGRAVAEGVVEAMTAACAEVGATDTWNLLITSCAEKSPSGGVHLFYRVPDGVAGNTKLAQRPARDDEYTDQERELAARGKTIIRGLIETRGEGGFVVVAPSHGPVHPTGQPYVFIVGDPATIPTITGHQRDLLHIAARTLDKLPPPVPPPEPTVLAARNGSGGLSPGDDYNRRGSWRELLQAHGWRAVHGDSTRTYWRRPGKAFGISAVTGGGEGDYLYCWTTSTVLPAEEAMSKFRVYAHLDHGQDFHAAAKKLKAQGFGESPPPRARPVLTSIPFPINGSSAEALHMDNQPITEPSPGVSLEQSDDGNALALIDRYGNHVRFCPERGRWLHWTGQRWEWCPPTGGIIREHAKAISRDLVDDDAAALRHKQRSLSAIGTTAMLLQASTDKRVVVSLAELDARPYELNTPGGIVDLRTGQVAPHDPAHLHTRITSAAPDADADDSPWLSFLADTFAGHDELPGYMRRLVGYSITGVVRDHVLPFLFGAGANGKGVFLETIRAVLGDYATTAPSGFLMAKNYAAHETEVARLAGARMVVCSEINESDKFDEAKVKQLTGGDTLTARFMRQDHFTFLPSHKLWLMGNHQPSVTSGGHSFWRRLRIVPFVNTVPEEKQVEDLQGVLAQGHGGAILSWVIAGAAEYFQGGLREPASVKEATEQYAKEQDTVSRFVAECCHLGGGVAVRIKVVKVREAYEQWCTTEGDSPVKPRTFGVTLRTRFGVGEAKSMSTRFYTGITLLVDDEETGSDSSLWRKDTR